jgi:xylulokinase
VNIFRQQVPVTAVTVIGGGAKGALWRQMMADIYGCRIESLRDLEEATSMGAAVIGGVACGLFADFDVIHRFIRVAHTVDPDPTQRAVYLKLMPIFEKAYLGLVGVYDDLAALQSKT